MPRLLIRKQGESPTIESPEMTQPDCDAQLARVESVISVLHREGGVEQARDVALDLGWCQIAAHVITNVEVVQEEAADA